MACLRPRLLPLSLPALVVDGGICRRDSVAQAVVTSLMQAQLDCDVPMFSVPLTPRHYQPSAAHQEFFAAHFVDKRVEAAQVLSLDIEAQKAA